MKNIYKNLIIMLSIIFCLATFSKTSYSQMPEFEVNEPKIYLEPLYSFGERIVESYDNGFLIVANAWEENDMQNKQGYILKLDINGILLWSKTIEEGKNAIVRDLCTTEDGGFVIAGDFDFENQRSGFVLKFSTCAETEWLTVLPSNIPEVGNKVQKGLHTTSDGGYLCKFIRNKNYAGKREGVVKLDASGKLVWVNFYEINPNEDIQESKLMRVTSEGGCIVSSNILKDNHFFPFFYKLSANGEIDWKTEELFSSFKDFPIDIIEEKDFYTAFWTKHFIEDEVKSPVITRISKDGSILNSTIVSNYTPELQLNWVHKEIARQILKLNEKYLLIVDGIHNLYITDNDSKILFNRDIDFTENFNAEVTQSTITKDNKIAGMGFYFDKGSYIDSLFHVSFNKYNQDLTYAEIDTEARMYDHKCASNIADGLVAFPPATNILDAPIIESSKVFQLDVFPNPAQNEIFITLPDYSKTSTTVGSGTINQYKQFEGKYSVVLFDIQGKEVYNQEFVYNDISQKLDVSGLKSGMYLIKITQNNQEVAQGKFVKK